jgi:iron(III) transport system substrate-binding protein
MCMRHLFRQRAVFVLMLIAALGVGAALPTDYAAAAEVVVVYTARHYGQEPVFEAFTKQTGIEMQSFDGSPSELFERLQAEGDKTPADVLISVDAGDLWNAAQAGLLAHIDSPELQANIPAHIRDVENRWFGLTVRARTIMRPSAIPNGRTVSVSGLPTTFTTSRF